jgi:hypothetical protein
MTRRVHTAVGQRETAKAAASYAAFRDLGPSRSLSYLAEREGALPSAMARTAIVAWVRQQIPGWRPGQDWVIERLTQEEQARRERRP